MSARWLLRRAIGHHHTTPLAGRGYAGPDREWFTRCCRCRRFRVVGQFVEMYGARLGDGWWYECLVCALDSMERLAMEEAGNGG